MLMLPSNFDNVAAAEIYDRVRTLDLNQDVELNAAEVSKITTLAVQTLLSLEKSLAQQGKALKIQNVTKDFKDVVTDLGLGEALARWSAA
jgi:hypothetical protein